MEKNSKNKSWDFLLPLVGIPLPDYFSLHNVFLYDNSHTIEKYNLLVCFKWSGHIKYEKALNIIRSNPQYRGEYDYCNGEYTIFIMEILPKFRNDYDLFLEGKYSMFSTEAKEIICRYRSVESVIKLVLDKAPELRERWEEVIGEKIDPKRELWSIYYVEDETLGIEKLSTSKQNESISNFV